MRPCDCSVALGEPPSLPMASPEVETVGLTGLNSSEIRQVEGPGHSMISVSGRALLPQRFLRFSLEDARPNRQTWVQL